MSLNIVTEIDNNVQVKNVLMSVSDKTGLETFVPALVKACPGVKIYSTGGTYTKVKEILGDKAEGTLVAVSDYTGQPEMQGGLVKTLDFKIYLGLLSEKYNDAHQADLKRLSALPIDMVVVNLYPFQATVAKEGVTPEMARTNIDIGGADHARTSDVDVRPRHLGRDAFLRDRRLERIEVHDDHVDRKRGKALEVRLVRIVVLLGKEPEVDLEVERLDEPALHLGLTGVVRNRDESSLRLVAENLLHLGVGPPGGVDLDPRARLDERGDEGLESGLVANAHQDVLDLDLVVDFSYDVQ